MEVLKISSKSNPNSVAGAIAGLVKESNKAEMQALEARDALGDKEKTGGRSFFCSAGLERFVKTGSAFLGWDIGPRTELAAL